MTRVFSRPHGATSRARHGPTNAIRLALEDAYPNALYEPELLARARDYRPILHVEQFHRVLKQAEGAWAQRLPLDAWRLLVRPGRKYRDLVAKLDEAPR